MSTPPPWDDRIGEALRSANMRRIQSTIDGQVREHLRAVMHAQDRGIAAEIVREARRRLDFDPVLRARTRTTAQVLHLDDGPSPAGNPETGRVRGADQFVAAVALVVAEKIPLDTRLIEVLAQQLCQLNDETWVGLLEWGNTAAIDLYREQARSLLAALTAAGYRVLTGPQTVAEAFRP